LPASQPKISFNYSYSSIAEDQRAQDTSSAVANEEVSAETRSDQQDTEDSYKKQLMDQLEKKVEEKSK